MSAAKKRTVKNSAIAAPITVTITGNLAAAVRFLAYTDGVSVEPKSGNRKCGRRALPVG